MNDHLIDWLVGVIAGIVATVICTWLWPLTSRRRKERSIAKFWRFKQNLVYIIRPSYKSPSGEDIDENMARVEDILAIDTITEMLNRRKINYEIVDHSAELPAKADLILVCSPKGNRRSLEALTKLDLPYSFDMKDLAKPYFIDIDNKVKFRSPMDRPDVKDIKDIALIGRYTKKGKDRMVFLLWGIHGVGTLGAAKCSVNQAELKKLNREVGDHDFAVLIECQCSSIHEVKEYHLITRARLADR